MNQMWWVGLQAFGFSVVLTPVFRDIFRSYKVVDQPDYGRKVHVHPIPRVGGIAIAIAYFLTFYLALPQSGEISRELSIVAKLLPAASLVFVTGLIDDFWGLKPWQKLLGQLVAACLVWWSGVRIGNIVGYELQDLWALPLTIGWLIVCTNAFNLVDGLDGLAAGVGLFASLTVCAVALIQGNEPLVYATVPLAGCLLGFLCFNFNPATVFLGDCGSLLIGFLLGCFGVLWAAKSATLLGLTAPLLALSIPLLDVILCIVRRWLRNQPIFTADRGHIHHRLLDLGLSPRQAVLLLYGLCGLAAIFSLLQSVLNSGYVTAAVVVLFAAMAWAIIHYLRYAEFLLAGQMLRTGEFQRSVNARLNLSSFEQAIRDAETLDDCWNVILGVRHTFGFAGVRLQAGGALYEDWPNIVDTPDYWKMHIPLGGHSSIELAREFGSQTLPMVVVPFIDLLAAALSDKVGHQSAAAASSPVAAPAALGPGS
jgi:UDP-GlcNAc:undecaprenyl-phosphate GlcNAc-1-phosphate transferase